MRPLKLRAWDIESKRMLQVREIQWDNHGSFEFSLECDPFDKWYGPDEIPLMQFTGLLDKNGKEIYEGDVLRFDDGELYKDEVVQWENQDERAGYNIYLWDRATVVGNIHEHAGVKK